MPLKFLQFELDDLRHEIPHKLWNLTVPLSTRMMLLKKMNTLQHKNIQEECDHPHFEKSECEECGFACKHWKIEDGYCLSCNCPMEYGDPRYDEYEEGK